MEKETKKLNESIISIRVKLQNSKLKKSGKNKFAGFDYFELADFLPRLNELMLEEGVNDLFYIDNEYATLELIKGEERNKYTIPFTMFATPLNKSGQPSMQDIQYLGALNTYYKRYLYLNAFGITDGEVIDSMNNEDLGNKQKQTNKQKESTLSSNELQELQFIRNELKTTCETKGLNLNEMAKKYHFNGTTGANELREALNKIEGEN